MRSDVVYLFAELAVAVAPSVLRHSRHRYVLAKKPRMLAAFAFGEAEAKWGKKAKRSFTSERHGLLAARLDSLAEQLKLLRYRTSEVTLNRVP